MNKPDLSLPCLSVRQPWATSILNGKPVENRSWNDRYRDMQLAIVRRHGGRFLLHASKGMTVEECADWRDFVNARIPISQLRWRSGLTFRDLPRGGIIGVGTVVEWVTMHESPWFVGPGALVLKDVETVEFTPCKGALGFFYAKP